MLAQIHRLLDRYRGLPADRLLEQPAMFALFIGIILTNLVLFLVLSQPFAFENALILALVSVSLTGLAHALFNWTLQRTTHLLLAQTYALLLYSIWVTGGLFSSSTMWMMILPVPAIYLLGWRESLRWIVWVQLTLLALVPLTQNGWLPVSYVYGPRHVLWSLGNHVFTAISLLGGLLVYQRIYNHQLGEITRRNKELSANRAALVQAEAYKDQFLASVSHELRTPMNAILGFNDVIRAELQTAGHNLQTVDLVRESTEHLLKLVNQILDFTQIQAGRLQLQPAPTRLADAFAECQQAFASRASASVQFHAQLDPALPEWVMTDTKRLKEVLCHLLENAFKFTPSGQVHLSIRQDGRHLLFEVQDTGVGIHEAQQAFIFNRFEHADLQTHTRFGGTGLGLAICKGLVQLFDGDIGLQSQAGQGSRFWFRVPLQACEAPDAPLLRQPPAVDSTRFSLLLVDDNPVNLKVGGLMCQQLWPDATLHSVNSGQACLQWLQTQAVDLVLMDLVMPEMDGLETTRAIRQSAAPLCHMAVIGLTASSHPQDHAACVQAGMNDVLLKPLDREQLHRSVLAQLLRRGATHG
jgi:signal transduction histidine kinase/ActR/RegA family two-component response regulator